MERTADTPALAAGDLLGAEERYRLLVETRGGGVINRVTKEAGFGSLREVDAQGGSYSNKRVTADFDQPLNDRLALRVNGLYESSGSFRGVDLLVSPRAGVIVKPTENLSLYGTYSVSYLPSSGDQFSSLTTITQQVEPEKFNNYEIGAKWDTSSNLSLTAAAYRLDRTNTRATDPNDPTRIVQTGSQRTNGYELGINGQITPAWSIAGGYAYQDAYVTSATTAARAGAKVPQVPHNTLSLWNNYQFLPKMGAALGIIYRTEMFATIDDTVTLPGYTRIDAAAYYSLTGNLRLQLNVENLLDKKYWANADSNTNLSPGSPRAIRLGIAAKL